MESCDLFKPIGTVFSTRKDPSDDGWSRESSYIRLNSNFGPEALEGLDQFSHVEVIFLMDKVSSERIESGSRRPRNNPNWPKVGIFAQRGKNRPNRLGLTVAKILRVDGVELHLEGLDAIDGSPVFDIKPWVREFGPRGEVRQPAWVSELMAAYWSPVGG